jgi:hypothetical protein
MVPTLPPEDLARLRSLAEDGGAHPLDRLRAMRLGADYWDALLRDVVTAARERGCTWAEIGEALGVTAQAAHQRFRIAVISDDA